MQPFICIERYCHTDLPKKFKTSKDELIELATASLLKLSDIKRTNDELDSLDFNNWGGREYVWIDGEVTKLRSTGGSAVHVASKIRSGNEDDSTRLDGLLIKQLGAIDSFNQDQLAGQLFVDRFDLGLPYHQLTVARTFMGIECPDCGHIQTFSSIKTHTHSMKCLQATHDRDLREAGWKRVEQSHYLTAIRKSGVQCDIRAAEFKMWIPSWVDAAIKQYEANKGYGGLKLEAYLTKMKP